MDAVWPGRLVEENNLQVHVAALRRLLGVARGLIKNVAGRGYTTAAPVGRPATPLGLSHFDLGSTGRC